MHRSLLSLQAERHLLEPAAAGPATLLERAQSGEREAFELLVRQHEVRVLRLAQRLIGCPDRARDAAQDAWIRFYRSIDRVDPSRPVWPYLARIVANCCHDDHRRRTRIGGLQPVDDSEEHLRRMPSEAPGPAREVEGGEQVALLRRALAALSEREREALVLRDVLGLSTQEVADAMGTGIGTVRSHVSRARIRLRQLMEGMSR